MNWSIDLGNAKKSHTGCFQNSDPYQLSNPRNWRDIVENKYCNFSYKLYWSVCIKKMPNKLYKDIHDLINNLYRDLWKQKTFENTTEAGIPAISVTIRFLSGFKIKNKQLKIKYKNKMRRKTKWEARNKTKKILNKKSAPHT